VTTQSAARERRPRINQPTKQKTRRNSGPWRTPTISRRGLRTCPSAAQQFRRCWNRSESRQDQVRVCPRDGSKLAWNVTALEGRESSHSRRSFWLAADPRSAGEYWRTQQTKSSRGGKKFLVGRATTVPSLSDLGCDYLSGLAASCSLIERRCDVPKCSSLIGNANQSAD